MSRSLLLVATLLIAGCSSAPLLPDDAQAELLRTAADSNAQAELIYEGDVRERGVSGARLYRYERRVQDVDGGVRSTHVTFTPSDEPVVMHQAVHDANYELREFREVHAQSGLVGEVHVAPDGTATFETTVDGRTQSRVEAPSEPLHVGPTLFGYVRLHWDSLMAGDVHPIRFVVMENRRSYLFDLKRVESAEGLLLEMTARNVFVRWSVPSIELWFDDNRDILRYEGLVPPLLAVGDRYEKLDATVTYEAASPYR